MTTIHGSDWDLFADISAITRWIDSANGDVAEDDAMRVMKIGEEYGEAVAAYIGMTGQNPRKGKTHTQADLCKELADIAITALCAIAHFTNNNPAVTQAFLASKITEIITRSNIPPYMGGQWNPIDGFQPLERVSAYPDRDNSAIHECDSYESTD
jgi:hypothetical protein